MNFQDIDSEALRITTECYERAKQVPLLGEHVKKHMEITSSYYYFFFLLIFLVVKIMCSLVFMVIILNSDT